MSYYRLVESRKVEQESRGCAWALLGGLALGLMLAAPLVRMLASYGWGLP